MVSLKQPVKIFPPAFAISFEIREVERKLNLIGLSVKRLLHLGPNKSEFVKHFIGHSPDSYDEKHYNKDDNYIISKCV